MEVNNRALVDSKARGDVRWTEVMPEDIADGKLSKYEETDGDAKQVQVKHDSLTVTTDQTMEKKEKYNKR